MVSGAGLIDWLQFNFEIGGDVYGAADVRCWLVRSSVKVHPFLHGNADFKAVDALRNACCEPTYKR